MSKFFCFVYLSALAAAKGDRVNINSLFDSLIERANDIMRDEYGTITDIPEIPVDSKVTYSRALILGLDSLRRTADCWEEVIGNVASLDISYGLGLMTILLPNLGISGTNMSAYARVWDNSVHMSFTMYFADEKCNVTLNDARIEKLENVEFGASRAEYDRINVEQFFKTVLMPKLNGIIYKNFGSIEAYLQESCNGTGSINTDYVEKVVKLLL